MENKELKEAAEKLYPIPFPNKFSNMNQEAYKERKAFISGAKWQQEQDKKMYSEQDMQEYATFCIRCYEQGLPCIIAQDWFKLYKNK